MMELFWTPEAIQDRDDIYEYIEADNPAAALALDELGASKKSPPFGGFVASRPIAAMAALQLADGDVGVARIQRAGRWPA